MLKKKFKVVKDGEGREEMKVRFVKRRKRNEMLRIWGFNEFGNLVRRLMVKNGCLRGGVLCWLGGFCNVLGVVVVLWLMWI